MYPKMFYGGFEGEDVKILCSNPRKALPCVNTRLLVYNRLNGLSSRSVERFCVQTNKQTNKNERQLWLYGEK